MRFTHNVGVPLRKLTTTEAFVVSDFADAPAVGIVRLAPKVLQRGAWEMARSATYQAALCGLKLSGASAGINSPADTKADAAAAFVEELSDDLSNGQLFVSPGKGIPADARAAFADADQRPADFLASQSAVHAASVIAAADAAAGGLDGKTVAIEGFGDTGPDLLSAALGQGATITSVSTTAGFVALPDSVDGNDVAAAWTEHGPGMVDHLSNGDASAAHMAFGAACDVLLIGSKMGTLNHKGTDFVKASTVVAHSEVPYTTKAAVQLGRAGVTVVPDVVSLSGSLRVAFDAPDGEADVDLAAAASESTSALVESLKSHPDGLLMGAFLTAEDFLRTWQDTLPFGRPFAA